MDTRYQPGQPVHVSLLFPTESITGNIVELGGRRAAIKLNRPVATGTPLRLDFEDSVVWGEVSDCREETDGNLVDFVVREALPTLSDLGRLMCALMEHDKERPAISTNAPAQSRQVV